MPYIDIKINKLTLNYDDISKKSDNKKEIIVEKKTIETNELPTNNTKIINNTKGELTIEVNIYITIYIYISTLLLLLNINKI